MNVLALHLTFLQMSCEAATVGEESNAHKRTIDY